jgi:cell division protein ZapA
MTEKAEKPNLVHVEIFGQTYTVRAGADPGYVERLAGYVDSQMQAVSRNAGAVDSVRIAVLAALNIADECFRLRDDECRRYATVAQRAEELERMLDLALGLENDPPRAAAV